ncbi:MAG: EamA family transporter [Candidatus Omnitrophota bacterium]
MFKKRITLKILLFLIASDILETCTHYCFKKSTLPVSEITINGFSSAVSFFRIVVFSPFLWLGFLFVGLTFVVWSTILSKIDLSVAVPAASFSYILVPLVSIVFLHEQIDTLRWCGIAMILLGIIFASISSKEKRIV